MKMIIDISKETYNEICWRGLSLCPRDEVNLLNAIRNGTPLPEGHGRLIDADELLNTNIDTFSQQTELKIKFAPTIIEGSNSK